jgi:hypothetical protein
VKGRTAALALVVVLPVAVFLPLREQLQYYDAHRVHDTVAVVPPGGIGYLNHASWHVRGLRPVRTGVQIRLDETALDAKGTVESLETEFLVYDRTGRSWSARTVSGGDSEIPGQVSHVTLSAEVPADITGQVEFVVRYHPLKPAAGPAPALRFRRSRPG